MTEKNRRPNRLAKELSPYLQQHAYNPVDWYPWGKDALDKAKRDQKPIFLSIGYSACHWCHVMEHESFENEETAKVMNTHFVNIKVDREERPDLDHIYMSAVQVMTQRGGWPMSVFLTPDLQPFYGGTYFPPEDKMGMPSFRRILQGVSQAWNTKRSEVLSSASQLSDAVRQITSPSGKESSEALSLDLLENALDHCGAHFDGEHGGFGAAPKFFHTMDLRLCLREYRRTKNPKTLHIATTTLTKMAQGGIYDHLGGGFHRYSTDARWLVPHFEKMLYDNALLAETYLEAFQLTSDPIFAYVASDTLSYVLREMTSPEGGFYSTQDADSEGVEGKYYVWKKEEIVKELGAEAAETFCTVYDVSRTGNWEDTNILNLLRPISEHAKKLGLEQAWLEDNLAFARRKLLQARALRVPPLRDEKILTSWNGMMIHSLALAGQVLNEERYLEAARAAANFIWEKLRVEGEPLKFLHTYKDGQARLNGYLEDYANLGQALVTLYESTFETVWLERAEQLSESILALFWDEKETALYFTSTNHETLLTRPQEIHDGATPSATAQALFFFTRLGKLSADQELTAVVDKLLRTMRDQLHQIPSAMGQYMNVLSFLLDSPKELVFCPGKNEEENETLLHHLRLRFFPNKVVVSGASELPVTVGKAAVKNEPTLYVCQNFTCQAPFVGSKAILKAIESW